MSQFEPVTTPKERCDECGFEYAAVSPAEAAEKLQSFGRRYRAPLTRFLDGEDGDSLLRTRPSPDVWSALEYAAHARDAIRFNGYMARRTLAEDHPTMPAPNPDKTADDNDYNSQDPLTVADELAERAEKLASMVVSTPPDDWGRTAAVERREGEFTALYFVRNAVHEGHHHLLDIGRVLRHVREANGS